MPLIFFSRAAEASPQAKPWRLRGIPALAVLSAAHSSATLLHKFSLTELTSHGDLERLARRTGS